MLYARRVDLLLQCIAAVEFVPTPELYRCQPQWQSIRRDRKTGVHLKPADNRMPQTPVPFSSGGILVEDANRRHVVAVIVELRRVVQHQNRRQATAKPISCGLKMSLQNLCFAHLWMGKKSIGRLGIGPILTRPRNTFSNAGGELLHQLTKPLVQPHIAKLASRQLCLNPALAETLPLLPHNRSSQAFLSLHKRLT
jgi:hypothetical protein